MLPPAMLRTIVGSQSQTWKRPRCTVPLAAAGSSGLCTQPGTLIPPSYSCVFQPSCQQQLSRSALFQKNGGNATNGNAAAVVSYQRTVGPALSRLGAICIQQRTGGRARDTNPKKINNHTQMAVAAKCTVDPLSDV